MSASLPSAFRSAVSKAPYKILIVDDDDEDKEFFREALQQVDASVICLEAADGLEALKILQTPGSELPDLIFLDLNMPRMGGKQCLAEIKKARHLCHLPVIIYTTSKRVEHRAEMKALGAAYFITKPIYHDLLCQSIAYVFSKEWPAMPAVPKPDFVTPLG